MKLCHTTFTIDEEDDDDVHETMQDDDYDEDDLTEIDKYESNTVCKTENEKQNNDMLLCDDNQAQEL